MGQVFEYIVGRVSMLDDHQADEDIIAGLSGRTDRLRWSWIDFENRTK